jgi:EpsD family peptidyl-prolyl cis-trans isomerase
MKTPGMFLLGIRAVAVASAAVLVLAACGEKKDKPATQTAARVNKEEITVHQINFLLQQQRGLRPEQTEAVSKQMLERLIDQELALQKAGELRLDRDPQVVQQLETARRDIVSRAYFEKVGAGASKPSAEEVKKYYDENPALFSQRRVYQLQELLVEAAPDRVPTLRAQLQEAKNVGEFVEYLKKNEYRFSANQAVRAAEQLPLATVGTFAQLKDGQAMLSPTPTGAQVIVLVASRSQPVDEERAKPAIEQFLVNERKRKIIADDLKALRAAAKVQYMGKFAEGAASAPTAAAPTAADVAASAAKGLDAAIHEGLGVKPVQSAPGGVPAPAAAGPSASAASGIDTSTINKGLGLK